MAANMRSSRSHLFRNVMLGIQIAISTILVCGTLTVNRKIGQLFLAFHLPDNLTPYKECILLDAMTSYKRDAIDKKIEQLPSIEKKISFDIVNPMIPHILENSEILAEFRGIGCLSFLCSTDTSLVSFYQLQVNWLHKPTESDDTYLLLNEGYYRKLRELGVVPTDALSLRLWSQDELTLPIAGTIPDIPYYPRSHSIMIHPFIGKNGPMYVLSPKKSKYQSLMREVGSTILEIEPSSVDIKVQNFHDAHNGVTILESTCTISWVLCAFSIIICTMGIYSTITLDTRSRRKEVAIRKVCGAKGRDIYHLFGSVYFLIVLLSFVIAIPVAALFHKMVFSGDSIYESPLIPCLSGSLIIMSMIASIVIWNIRNIMRINPAEIIAKE
ncbi:MAG: ABC transporter permease [Bacteroidaceae bacterium]